MRHSSKEYMDNWRKNNPEKLKQYWTKTNAKESHKKYMRKYSKEYNQRPYVKEQKKLQYSNRWDDRRELMNSLKINGCAICGYNNCTGALDFHHTNPEDKLFGLWQPKFSKLTDDIIDELNKCILLCKNCHSEIEELKRRNKNEKN